MNTKRLITIALSLILAFALTACGNSGDTGGDNTASPAPVSTPDVTPSPVNTPSETPTPESTPSETPTSENTPSVTPTPENAPSETPTPENTPTPSDEPTPTPAAPLDDEELEALFSQIPRNYYFTSGDGGWETHLNLFPVCKNGTLCFFTGYQEEYDASDKGSGYKLGTQYECYFMGNFAEVKKINEFEYSMKFEGFDLIGTPGEIVIKYNMRFITLAEPNGLTDAEEYRLYLPGRSTHDLPEAFLELVVMPNAGDEIPSELPFVGLHNISGEIGFAPKS